MGRIFIFYINKLMRGGVGVFNLPRRAFGVGDEVLVSAKEGDAILG